MTGNNEFQIESSLPWIPNDKMTIWAMNNSVEIKELRRKMLQLMVDYRYSYNFTWYGRPIIQIPDDIVAIQEIVLGTKPDLIIETGVAHGGSIILYASLMQLLGRGEVVGVDIEIRPANRKAIEEHPLHNRIKLIEGSSVDERTLEEVRDIAEGKQKIMVILDSMHTHEHVFKELELYSPFVREGSYIIVYDTVIEDLGLVTKNRPWGKGDNPKTAVWDFLKKNDRFKVDHEVEDKLIFTTAPDGYLRCIRD